MGESRRSRVQQEIGQSVPFRSPSQEAVVAIARTADVLRRRAERALAPFDLTPQQYNVLRILRGARGAPLPTLEIGARMVERTPGVTRLVDRLVTKGLVRREPCAEDRRVVFCRSTDAGLGLLVAADPAVTAFDEEIGEVVPGPEIRRLLETLDSIRGAFEP
jgi:DNA-binding MarR family transcriptional regulator